MLNEKRVKHMVKLASYETKNWPDDYKVSSYFKRDYISFNIISALIWVTLGYGIIVGLFGIAYMEPILDGLTMQKGILLIVGILVAYIFILIVYGIISYFYYRKKYHLAKINAKKFEQGLEALDNIYKEENM